MAPKNRHERTLSGTFQVECHECDEEASATVEDGKVTLPEDWEWFEMKCNWGNGLTLMPQHVNCPDGWSDTSDSDDDSTEDD